MSEREQAKQIIDRLPENEKVVLLMDLGYAAEGTRPTPTHEKTKPIEELVTYC